MTFNERLKRNRCDSVEQSDQDITPTFVAPLDELLDDYMLRTRRLWIVGEINEFMATSVCSYLQMLSLINDPIYLYINSPGGCVASGYAIIDQILACKSPVYTIVRGQAQSMGAIIAAFGSKGHRYISPNSSMMLHAMIIHYPPDTIDKHIGMIDFAKNDYISKVTSLARRMKISKKQLLASMEATQWMSPKHAIKIGLVDHIWTSKMERSLNGDK